MNELYGLPLLERRNIINPYTYIGRGRPKNTDYINFEEANRLLNAHRSKLISLLAEK